MTVVTWDVVTPAACGVPNTESRRGTREALRAHQSLFSTVAQEEVHD
ncbi:hypothetical protein ACFYZB_12130 [Streptomyces sp. NPDC001852]